jgi:hypothetical protein
MIKVKNDRFLMKIVYKYKNLHNVYSRVPFAINATVQSIIHIFISSK